MQGIDTHNKQTIRSTNGQIVLLRSFQGPGKGFTLDLPHGPIKAMNY